MYVHVTQVRIHTHTYTHLFCRQMSRLMHAWKSRDTGPYPDSAASLSNMQLTVRRRNTGSQASGTLFITSDDTRREFKRLPGDGLWSVRASVRFVSLSLQMLEP